MISAFVELTRIDSSGYKNKVAIKTSQIVEISPSVLSANTVIIQLPDQYSEIKPENCTGYILVEETMEEVLLKISLAEIQATRAEEESRYTIKVE